MLTKIKRYFEELNTPPLDAKHIEEAGIYVENNFLPTTTRYSAVGKPGSSEPEDPNPWPKWLPEQATETFTDMLFRKITEKGLTDVEVYKNAWIDRRIFSKMRKDRFYHPHKENVFVIALAMHMEIDEATDFLNYAGYSFSPYSKYDLIMKYCFENHIYNLFHVNELLAKYTYYTL